MSDASPAHKALPAVLADLRPEAFEGTDMSPQARRLHRNRTAPGVVRRILAGLQLSPGDRVLQVGTGPGYLTAALARLCRAVVSLEVDPAVARETRARLQRMGVANVEIVETEGLEGWPAVAPYDAILVSARTPRVPRALARQLTIGGRMVAFLGLYRARQGLVRLVRIGDDQYTRSALGEVQLLTRLDHILVELGGLTAEEGEAAVREHLTTGLPLERILQEKYQITERDMVRAVALQRGFLVGDVAALLQRTDPRLRHRLAEPFSRFNRVLPIAVESGRLAVATSNPDADFEAVHQAFAEAHGVAIHLLSEPDFQRLWTIDPDVAQPEPVFDEVIEANLLDESEHLSRFTELFRALLLEAVAEGASDLHLERYGKRVRTRLRVDGALYDAEQTTLSPSDLVGVVNVIKVQAQLDIADRNHPQGGRFRTHAGSQVFDLRVQTQPALDGEHVVIRLLSHRGAQRSIDGLGFGRGLIERYRRLLDSPQGLVLVVGPTGSGKSTTLYAGLTGLAEDATRKVITVEDPIEYSITGIQQTAVRARHGFSFADAMRAFVRQDPDVILVGEIRDPETALEALRASQTGHLVLSTLHCNDAPDAVQRLFDLGMHPNSIAAELQAVLAQRLARRICVNCRQETEPDPVLLAEVFPDGPPVDFKSFAGRGCPRCRGRGLSGRIAVGEMLLPSQAFKRATARSLPLDELRAVALSDGMVPLRSAALTLVADGVIPLAELRRLLPPDRMGPDD